MFPAAVQSKPIFLVDIMEFQREKMNRITWIPSQDSDEPAHLRYVMRVLVGISWTANAPRILDSLHGVQVIGYKVHFLLKYPIHFPLKINTFSREAFETFARKRLNKTETSVFSVWFILYLNKLKGSFLKLRHIFGLGFAKHKLLFHATMKAVTQQAHNIKMASYQRRCDVFTSHRWPRWRSWMRVRLETRRSRVRPPPRSATFFRGDWSWNIFYGHSLPSADSRRAVVSFWRKNVHNTG